MGQKSVVIDGRTWGVESAQAEEVNQSIEQAMSEATVVALPLLKEDGSPVTVYFNGRLAASAVYDDGAGPRPTEIPG